MPRAWRITKTKYESKALEGEGARRHGGRWTSPGLRVIHASESLSLATLEILVQLQASAPIPAYSVFTVEIPDALVEELAKEDLPANWRAYPSPASNRALGDGWIASGRSAVLQTPSAMITHEHNFLINPEHKDFVRLDFSIPKPFDVDPRVFQGTART